jgi:flavodoxin
VIIGSPVWAGKIAPSIRKFIVTNNFTEKIVALFVTLDGNKPEKSLENMKAAISTKRLVGEFGFIRPMENEEKTEEQVKTWCSELGKSLGPT